MNRVIVTGGAGFIGSHLVDLHIRLGDEVIVIDDLSAGARTNLATHLTCPRFRLVEAKLQTWPELGELLKNADLVYHLAAVVGVKHVLESPANVISTNLTATERLVNEMTACGSSAKLLVASSSEVYGFSTKPAFQEDDDLVLPSTNPVRWCYAVTKLADEMLAFAANYQNQLATVTVRLFNTVGTRQGGRYGMVMPNFVDAAIHGRPLMVFGDGTQTRSFCDVRDTVRILHELMQAPDALGQVVNVGADQEISILDLAVLVKSLTGSTSDIEFADYRSAYGLEFRDVTHRRPSLARLETLIHYKRQYNLVDTIIEIARSMGATSLQAEQG